jgi:hypothetical protein
LYSKDLSINAFKDRFNICVETNSKEPWVNALAEVFSDTPHLLLLFERGDYATVVGLGWGMLDRGLGLVRPESKTIRQRAMKLGIPSKEFELCYDARNQMTHAGVEPKYRDALNALLLLKQTLELLAREESA